jgi:hypothetical protein
VTGVVQGTFEKMCRQFAEAGAAVLKAVADAFLATSTIDLSKAGIDRVLVVTTSIGMGMAVLLLLGQVIRTGVTMRGEHLAHGIVGVLKAALITGTVLAVATALLAAADALSRSIMEATFGSTQAFSDRFAHAVTFTSLAGPTAPIALLLVFGLVAILVGVVLFGEMLFRHAAVVVLVALAPIGASGLVGGSTTGWWRKMAAAAVQLIFLKPLIVLVFAVGFGVAGNSDDVLGVMAGLVTLAIAAFAWPILARSCTWTTAHVAEAGGVTSFAGGFLGAEVGRLPRRFMSAQARGSAFESDRATMARNSNVINAAGAARSSQLVGAGVGGAAAAAGLGLAAAAKRGSSAFGGPGPAGGTPSGHTFPGPVGPSDSPPSPPRPDRQPPQNGPKS